MTPKTYTDEQLKWKAEAYCAAAERCASDVLQKLQRWNASDKVIASIMQHLYNERYLDDSRYCHAFVRDKYRLAHWGREKIKSALYQKRLPASLIQEAIETIETDTYTDNLARLLAQKRTTLKARNTYELNTKLIRYALGKGYRMDEILKYIDHDFSDNLPL